MSSFRPLVACACAGILSLFASHASAALIAVPNGDFESPTVPTVVNNESFLQATGAPPAITGWTQISSAGSWGVHRFFGTADNKWTNPGSVYDGTQVLWMNQANTIETAANLATVAANTDYILTVQMGWRSDLSTRPVPPNNIQLLANGVVISPTTISIPTLAAGDFKTATATFSAATMAAFVGQDLKVRLLRTSGNIQSSFDNVTLDASPIPEPASLALLGLGAAAVFARRRTA